MDFQLDLSILLMRILRSGNLPKITQGLTGGTKIQTEPEPTFLTPLYVATLHSTFSYLLPPRVMRCWFKLGFTCFKPRVKPFSAPLMRHEQFRLWKVWKTVGSLFFMGLEPHPLQDALQPSGHIQSSQLARDVPSTPRAGGSFTLN